MDENPVVSPLIVGFSGRAGAGKTTIAGMVWKDLMDRFHRSWVGSIPQADGFTRPAYWVGQDSFAAPIKRALRELGVEKGDPLYRSLAQNLGAKCRAANPDHFVDLLLERLTRGSHYYANGTPSSVLLIDDARHFNEFHILDLHFHVSRPEELLAPLTREETTHESEMLAVMGPQTWPNEYRDRVIEVDNHPLTPLETTCKKIANQIWAEAQAHNLPGAGGRR